MEQSKKQAMYRLAGAAARSLEEASTKGHPILRREIRLNQKR